MGISDCMGACGGCIAVLTVLGYLGGSVVCLYYSAKAWHDEKDADTSADGCGSVFSWNVFITIWSGVICYGLFFTAKQAASSKNVLAEAGATIAVLWLFGVGFGFGTYEKYYNICDSPDLSQTAKSIEVFMYFWLTVAGSITAGAILAAVAAAIDACTAPPPTPPGQASSYRSGTDLARVVVVPGGTSS